MSMRIFNMKSVESGIGVHCERPIERVLYGTSPFTTKLLDEIGTGYSNTHTGWQLPSQTAVRAQGHFSARHVASSVLSTRLISVTSAIDLDSTLPSSVGVFDTGLVIGLLESAKGKAETAKKERRDRAVLVPEQTEPMNLLRNCKISHYPPDQNSPDARP